MYEVISNVPLPAHPTSRKRGRPPKYPVRDMKVGDSFFIPIEPDQTAPRIQQRFLEAVAYYKAQGIISDERFTTRTMGDHIGVWRVK